MKILKKMEIDLIKDRNQLKFRVNIVGKDKIVGFIKPVKYSNSF
jgi:hypothetical protein